MTELCAVGNAQAVGFKMGGHIDYTQIGDIDPSQLGGLDWRHARAYDLFEFLHIAAQLCQ